MARRPWSTLSWVSRPRSAGACSCSLARWVRSRMPGRKCNRAKGIRDRFRDICYGAIRGRRNGRFRRNAARPKGPPLFPGGIEEAQIRRSLIFSRRHEMAFVIHEVVLLADNDMMVVLGTVILKPQD